APPPARFPTNVTSTSATRSASYAHSPPPSALSPSFSTNDTRSNRGDDPAPPTNTPAPPPLPSVCTARFRVKTHCRTTTLAPSPTGAPVSFVLHEHHSLDQRRRPCPTDEHPRAPAVAVRLHRPVPCEDALPHHDARPVPIQPAPPVPGVQPVGAPGRDREPVE